MEMSSVSFLPAVDELKIDYGSRYPSRILIILVVLSPESKTSPELFPEEYNAFILSIPKPILVILNSSKRNSKIY